MKQRYFVFLRRLHVKGRNNMYGAVPYLMRASELNRDQAFAVVCEWIDLQQSLMRGRRITAGDYPSPEEDAFGGDKHRTRSRANT